jgi:competence protein ComEA
MEYLKNNKGIVIVVIGVLALLIYNFSDIGKTEKSPIEYSETLLTTTTTTIIESTDNIMVDIKGEVNYPGLYKVEEGLRLGEIINIAGGATALADLSNINLALRLVDEMNITIPRKVETVATPYDVVKIKVEIKGEVTHPGVYILFKNSRVSDLIELAGGLKTTADTEIVQQAKILSDGETIFIPKLEEPEIVTEILETREIYVEIFGEVITPGIYLVPEDYSIQDLIYEAGGVTVNCDLDKVNWATTLCLGASIYIPSYIDDIVELETQSDKVNINTADLEELSTLSGIGQILGQRIIDYRAEYGDFLCIEDIVNVSGIKSSIYEEIKESITV